MATLVTDGFDPGDDEQMVEILRKWRGGPLSDILFTQLAGLIPQPIVEVVVLRWNEKLQTLLLPRPEGDPVWPGMVHTPGVALRRADFFRSDNDPLAGAFERIQQGELGQKFIGRPRFVGVLHRVGRRGPEVAQIFWTEIDFGSKLKEGHEWYPVDKLESHPHFIQDQLGHVKMAVAHYFRHTTR